MAIDLSGELNAWLATPEARRALGAIVETAVEVKMQALLRDDLVNVEEAGQMLGISAAAVRKRVERGQLIAVRIGRSLRFRRSDLLQR